MSLSDAFIGYKISISKNYISLELNLIFLSIWFIQLLI